MLTIFSRAISPTSVFSMICKRLLSGVKMISFKPNPVNKHFSNQNVDELPKILNRKSQICRNLNRTGLKDRSAYKIAHQSGIDLPTLLFIHRVTPIGGHYEITIFHTLFIDVPHFQNTAIFQLARVAI